MSASRSSHLSPAIAEEPTPQPASAVGARRAVERQAALVAYFTRPSPEKDALDAAWEEALTLYGDEDSEAWVSALEQGTHPLCRVPASQRPA